MDITVKIGRYLKLDNEQRYRNYKVSVLISVTYIHGFNSL